MRKFIKIAVLSAISLVTLYFGLFKTVMVVSYVRTEGCGELVDSSGAVLVSPQGHVRDIAGVGLAVQSPPPVLMGRDLEIAANEPRLIKSIKCLNNSQCQVWEKPGLTPVMVTLLVSGPSYDSLYYKPFFTGTELDEVQSYFQQRGVEGVAIAIAEAAPRCLNMNIAAVNYDHALRWKWSP